jgi:hypothetical protein
MPFELSCMPSFKKVGMLYAKSNGTPLHQEFYYELIFTWPKRIKSSLLMWWLLTQHMRRWLWVSFVDQHVQLWKLVPLLRSTNIEGFVKGTTLFWWPWRYITPPSVIWIGSSGNVLVFSMINGRKVIYPFLFSFNFLGSVLVLLFSML